MPEKTPARLYKYQALDRQTLENLVNRCIYFSKPENFNDPFDCWEAIAFLDPMVDQEEWKKIYQNIVSTASKENKPLKETEGQARARVRGALTRLQARRQEVLQGMGVACFSATPADNILMWSHYADKHKGFCLEFDTQHEPFKQAEKVIYSDKYVTVPFSAFIEEDSAANHRQAAQEIISDKYTKSSGWQYEQEWRIFHSRGNFAYHYDATALTGIYFGCRMLDRDKQIIQKTLEGTATAFYSMERSPTRFEVVPKPIRKA